jgi:hypothetical protein
MAIKERILDKRSGVLCHAGGEHVRDQSGHCRRPQHIIESVQATADEKGINILKKVINVLHCQQEIFLSQIVWILKFRVEFREIHFLSHRPNISWSKFSHLRERKLV